KRAAYAELGDDRVQTFPPVDLLVEERVEEVESRDPEGDGSAEHPRLPGEPARDGDPGTDRREAVDRAEPEVAEPGDPLEVRVDDEADDRDRPEPADDRIELPDGREEERQRGEAEGDHLRDGELAARDLPAGGTGISGIDPRVDQTVERHRKRAGTDHRERDPQQIVRARRSVHGKKRADIRERQREDRVLDLHQPRKPRGERCGRGLNGHVCSWAVGASASSSSACPSAGRRTAKPSRQPPVEPGRLTTSVAPRAPAAPRESSRCFFSAIDSARSACAMRGPSRSSTWGVASGATPRGARPAPPVVSTSRAEAASSRIAAAISSRSSATT